MTEYIAERKLIGCRDGQPDKEIWLRVGKPYQCDTGEWACSIALDGLHNKIRDVHGEDSWQALMLAQNFAKQMLIYFVEDGGRLLDGQQACEINLFETFSTGVF